MEVTLWLNPEQSLLYTSYHVIGFIQLAHAGEIDLKLRTGLPDWIDLDKVSGYPKSFRCYMLLEARTRTKTCRLALNFLDSYSDMDPYILDQVDIFYMSNYNPAWINEHMPPEHAEKIKPAGIFFPLPLPYIKLLRWSTVNWPLIKFLWTWSRSSLPEMMTVDEVESWRILPPERDIFFSCSAWADADGRNTIISRLKQMPIAFYGGFRPTDTARQNYPENTLPRAFPYRDYMRNLATSRITIITRGVHDCFTWKLPQQLALGSFILCEPLVNTLPVRLEDGVHMVFLQEDLSDLESKVSYYLEHEQERKQIAANGAQFFDEQCRPEKICHTLLATL